MKKNNYAVNHHAIGQCVCVCVVDWLEMGGRCSRLTS